MRSETERWNDFKASLRGEVSRGRCCAKCRTPYNCGNNDCTCHQRSGGTEHE